MTDLAEIMDWYEVRGSDGEGHPVRCSRCLRVAVEIEAGDSLGSIGRTIQMHEDLWHPGDERQDLLNSLGQAKATADEDSNDNELDALNDALQEALALLEKHGVQIPEES